MSEAAAKHEEQLKRKEEERAEHLKTSKPNGSPSCRHG